MNRVVNNIVSKNIACLEAGAFQEFCKKFFLIYRNLLFYRFGATSDGKTRKGTPDFLLLQNNKQICLQISIEKNYWYKKETKPKQDIDKCVNKINDVKKIFLCSNQELNTANPNAKKNVIDYVKQYNIELECYSLEDFENIISNNLQQYQDLIKEFFNNEDLKYLKLYYTTKEDFINICKKNIELYKQNINIENDVLIKRTQEILFCDYVKNNNGLIFLVSTSGNGKSTLCATLAEIKLSNSQFVLWIKPQSIEDIENYENWILNAIRETNINLISSVNVIKEYFKNDEIILIIDDINNIQGNREVFIKKLKNISKEIKKNKFNIKIICPIWNINNKEEVKHYTVFHLDTYTQEEALDAVKHIFTYKNIKNSVYEMKTLIKSLNNDPYLIGLLNELPSERIKEINNFSPNIIFETFINYITSYIEEKNSNYLAIEYKNAIYSILYKQLMEKLPTINFDNIVEEKDKIRKIVQNKKICRLDENNNIIFRHDRLKNYLQVQALIKHGNVDDSILIEPFYTNIISQYIAIQSITKDKINLIQKENPIVMLRAINYIEFDSSYLKEYILQTFYKIYISCDFNIYTLKNTVDKKNKNIGSYYNIIQNYADQNLINIDNFSFVENLKVQYKNKIKHLYSDGVLLLQFKFGNLVAGLMYYQRWINIGELYVNDIDFNRCISYIKQNFSREEINKACNNLIMNVEEKYKKTSLVISGLLGASDINKCIKKIWNENNRDEYVAYCIYALIQCFNKETSSLLKELLIYWTSMSDKNKSQYQSSPRPIVTGLLDRAINHVSEDTISFLIKCANEDQNIAPYIIYILRNVDSSEVCKFKIKYYVEHPRLILSISDNFKIKNPETIQLIKNIWLDKNEEIKYRQKALVMYSPYIKESDIKDLKELENIKEDISEIMYLTSCKYRARLNDVTVRQNICELISNDLHNIEQLVLELQNIWDKSLIPFIVNLFNTFSDKNSGVIILSELLLRIDYNDAENIIIQCIKNYEDCCYIWETVIILGTKQLLNIATKYFKKNPVKRKFNFLFFNTKFQSDKQSFKFDVNCLKNFIPFIKYMDTESIVIFLKKAKEENLSKNLINQIYKNIPIEIQEQYNIKTKDECYYEKCLDEMYNNQNSIYNFYSLGLDYNKKYSNITNDEISILLNLLPKWYEKYKDLKAYNMSAQIIDMIGKRKNITILVNMLSFLSNNEDKVYANRILFNTKYSLQSQSLF